MDDGNHGDAPFSDSEEVVTDWRPYGAPSPTDETARSGGRCRSNDRQVARNAASAAASSSNSFRVPRTVFPYRPLVAPSYHDQAHVTRHVLVDAAFDPTREISFSAQRQPHVAASLDVRTPSSARSDLSAVPVQLSKARPPLDELPPTMVRATPPQRKELPPSNWTVKEPGNTKVPTSHDYNLWDREQLRKECTARKKKIKRNIPDECNVRREWLRENDLDRAQLLKNVDPEMAIPAHVRLTANCRVRLCNVLVSDKFVDDLVRSEDPATRQALDTSEVGSKSIFWVNVAIDFRENHADYNGLYTEDPRFAELRPDIVIPHDSAQLYKAWSDLMKLYAVAYSKSTRSGEHSDDFFGYCDGRLDVAYLHFCVNTKPQIASFVRVKMPKEAQLDSTKQKAKTTAKTKVKNARQDNTVDRLMEESSDLKLTLKALASFVTRESEPPVPQVTPSKPKQRVQDLLECLSKSYAILDQLEESRSKAESRGRPTEHLDRAIDVQLAGNHRLQEQYEAAMELKRPRKRARAHTPHSERTNTLDDEEEKLDDGEEKSDQVIFVC